jgi:Alpha/beta hydrolase domain
MEEIELSNFMRESISKQSSLGLLLTVVFAFPIHAAIPTPKVTGPIPKTAKPGDPSHNYPYGAASINLAQYGYREDEFYIEGAANEYTLSALTNAVVKPGGPYAYKTRVTVRRPVSASKFNGTVILEWNSAAAMDQETDWSWSYDHMMRRGFAYVGVSAEPRSIDGPYGLKKFNPARYGSLDVNAGGKFNFQLSYDIYSQVAQALKHPEAVSLLGASIAKNVIATGHSSSGARLIDYYNSVHALAGIIDGFLIQGANGRPLRTDLKTPGFRLLSETDAGGPGAVDQPDSDYYRSWEVAGAAHADWDLIQILDAVFERDMPQFSGNEKCDQPPMSRVPSHLVQDAVYDWIKVWIEEGKQPPHAPRIKVKTPGGGRGSNQRAVLERDENGNALGGIRLPQFAVPIATDTGENSGGQFCNIYGSHVPFDKAKLDRLYSTHAAYVAAIERITNENLKAGYITKEGADRTKKEAAASKIGR